MINYLKDVSTSTFIGQLPEVITFNNKSIKNEFEMIYDSSLNRLKKSVYAPEGSVEVHWGNFVNLQTKYLTVTDTASFEKLLTNSQPDLMERISILEEEVQDLKRQLNEVLEK